MCKTRHLCVTKLPHAFQWAIFPVQCLLIYIVSATGRRLNRGILNAISCEVRKSLNFHNNVVLEVLLTQNIMRECDQNFVNIPGYIQNFPANPFATHMYSETDVGILVAHMRRKKPVKLYMDTTGSVVSKIKPEEACFILCTCFTWTWLWCIPLACGRDAYKLPHCTLDCLLALAVSPHHS